MILEEIFQNLTPTEFLSANDWYDKLKQSEQERIKETLETINSTDFSSYTHPQLRNDLTKISVIVVGSSIDSKFYNDIDLFLLSESPLGIIDEKRKNPSAVVNHFLMNKLYDLSVFPGASFDELDIDPFTGIERNENEVAITYSLFHDLTSMQERRPKKVDDFLAPKKYFSLGAEEIIRYNKEANSKFRVLSRQYD